MSALPSHMFTVTYDLFAFNYKLTYILKVYTQSNYRSMI